MVPIEVGKFLELLANARKGVSELLKQYPEDRILKSISIQLEFVEEWATNGADPKAPRLEKLNFGLMASKCVDDTDRDLAALLYELAGQIDDYLGKSPY